MIYSFYNSFAEISEKRGATPMVNDYEVREALRDAAKTIHDYDNNPSTWLSWLIYLLDQLENQSRDVGPSNHERYMEMIEKLKDAVHTRQSRGGW
jgi:hypothetical protein